MAIGLSDRKHSMSESVKRFGYARSIIVRWLQLYKPLLKKAPMKHSSQPQCTTLEGKSTTKTPGWYQLQSSAAELKIVFTIFRRLIVFELWKRKRNKVPLLCKANIAARLHCTMTHVASRAPVWDRIIFNDKSRFHRIKNDGGIMVWRSISEFLIPKDTTCAVQTGGGSDHVWMPS